jgi:hypothetical protein
VREAADDRLSAADQRQLAEPVHGDGSVDRQHLRPLPKYAEVLFIKQPSGRGGFDAASGGMSSISARCFARRADGAIRHLLAGGAAAIAAAARPRALRLAPLTARERGPREREHSGTGRHREQREFLQHGFPP